MNEIDRSRVQSMDMVDNPLFGGDTREKVKRTPNVLYNTGNGDGDGSGQGEPVRSGA